MCNYQANIELSKLQFLESNGLYQKATQLLIEELDSNYEELKKNGMLDEYLEEVYAIVRAYSFEGDIKENLQKKVYDIIRLSRDSVKDYLEQKC